MPVPSSALVFESGIHAIPGPGNSMRPNSLDALVRHQLEAASRDLASEAEFTAAGTAPGHHQNIINDVGDYLAQTARMWYCLTNKLVQGPHVERAAEEAHEQSFATTYMADLQPMATMDINITKLGKIRDLAEKFSEEVQEVWRRKPDSGSSTYQTAPAFPAVKSEPASWIHQPPRESLDAGVGLGLGVGVRGGQRNILTSQNTDDTLSPGGNASGSEDSGGDEDEQFSKIDMDALKQRGKGAYHCPLEYRCDKGGVDKDGKLVIFDRNSSFAKPWRCDVPGCPNPPKKRKFARRDGLERHKLTVKHRVMS
ncbi:unnamed protein product [Fusarium graminearum]|uniref:Uncharacterized protein n=1 Tax=Gibberella zeae (strain ATCC MYA-4620 / CBS 123657 / FGSC 9075 / NRRL 31084 / PH-1) TaxID=229533 RepID=A0A0E0RZY7_GIBZE|nr:hypothetical protein FG05_08461 [Fusarium graminearum]CZS80103.1 unnamed protein product [Fusarium graminearum]